MFAQRSGMSGRKADRLRPLPVPVILRLLSELALHPDDPMTGMIAKFASADPKLFALPPDELVRYIRRNSRFAASMMLIIELLREKEFSNDIFSEDFSDYNNASRFFMRHFMFRPAEQVVAAPLDSDRRIIGDAYVSGSGTSFSTYMPVREIVRVCVLSGAYQVVVSHNHPDGEALPSVNDIIATKKLAEILNSFEIDLADHIIIAGTDSFSMRLSGQYPQFFSKNEFYRRKSEK